MNTLWNGITEIEGTVDVDVTNIVTSEIKGSSGNIADVNEDGQLHVVLKGKVDSGNSSSTPLSAGGIFTGQSIETLSFAVIIVSVYSDVESAINGLSIEQSVDNVNWDHCDCFTIPAATGKTFSFQPQALYLRIVYTNGGSDQTEFRLQTTLKKTYIKPSSHRIQDPIIDQDDAELVKAIITGKRNDGVFDNVNLTNGSNMKVSLEEIESGISSNGNSQLNVTLFDEGGVSAEVDNTTKTIQVINFPHHEIHEGDHYFIRDVVDLAINNVYDIQITTPNTTKWSHLVGVVIPENEMEFYFYEGVIINTPGTIITARNNNRNSVNVSGMVIAGILNTSIANANSDTAIGSAIQLEHGIVGSGRTGGIVEREMEIILKQNTSYSLRFIANAAGYTNFNLLWYEHTNN